MARYELQFKHSCPDEDCEGDVLIQLYPDPPDNNSWDIIEPCDECGASDKDDGSYEWMQSVEWVAHQVWEDYIEGQREAAAEARFEAHRDGEI